MTTILRAGSTEQVISVKGLKVYFEKGGFLQPRVVTKAVDGVDLNVLRREVLGVVGESGSGKTTLGRSVVGLQRPTEGSVVYYRRQDGTVQEVDLYGGKMMKNLRRELQMIFQDPYSSIDPIMKVHDALYLPLKYSGSDVDPEETISFAMDKVGLPRDLLGNYVFQLSGGQRQRLGIARALLFKPSLIVADEPVSMVDASLKGEIIGILNRVKEDLGTSFLFVTHEMAVARAFADRVAVMYLGKVVEIGKTEDVIMNPLHPYTKLLIEASPKIDPSLRGKEVKLNVVEGEIPSSSRIPSACRYRTRCPFKFDLCERQEPTLEEVRPGHFVACWLSKP